MFTGLVETVGEVSEIQSIDGDLRIAITTEGFNQQEIAIGDSIAINGVCLTVVSQNAQHQKKRTFFFDVSKKSIDHTLIGQWRSADMVNLELALLPSNRLGGHIVSGHVDGVATLTHLNKEARSIRMAFNVAKGLEHYIAKKGSITINGISLTVNEVSNTTFDVNIIPHTYQLTNLSHLSLNDKVHIEVDVLARYLERLLMHKEPEKSEITSEVLVKTGFINK